MAHRKTQRKPTTPTWRIVPVSKCVIIMVSPPIPGGCGTLSNWLFPGFKKMLFTNYLLSRMILLTQLFLLFCDLLAVWPIRPEVARGSQASPTSILPKSKSLCYRRWFRSPVLTHPLRLVVYLSIYRVFVTSKRWLFGISETSTVVRVSSWAKKHSGCQVGLYIALQIIVSVNMGPPQTYNV